MGIETQKIPTSELTRRQKLLHKTLPAVALLAAGGYAALETESGDDRPYGPIASVDHVIAPGEHPIDAINNSLSETVFDTYDVNNEDITREGQEVGREIRQMTGDKYVQPGDTINVSILANGDGDYVLEADPVKKD